MNRFHIFAIILSSSILSSCVSDDIAKKDLPQAPTENDMSDGRRPFGRIEQVKLDERFVILSAYGPVPDDNRILCTRNLGADETSRLKLSPEKKNGLLAADIISGQPNIGDMVFVHRNLGGEPAKATPSTPTEKKKPAKKSSQGTNPIGQDINPPPSIEKIPTREALDEPPVELAPEPAVNDSSIPDVP